MKKILLLSLVILLTNCASILSPKYQKVTITTNSADSKVYVNDELQGEGSTVVTKMKRDLAVKQVKIETPGYKDVYDTHYQVKKGPLHILSWIPFGITFYAPFLDKGKKSYDYRKKMTITEAPVKVIVRDDNMKYLYLKKASFDVKKEDLKFKLIKRRKFDKNKKKYKSETSYDKAIEYDNTVFANSLNSLLYKNNFADSTSTLFAKKANTAYISASVTNVDFQEVYEYKARGMKSYIFVEAVIKWSLYDLYDQLIFEKIITARSGKFTNHKGKENLVLGSIDDAIKSSFFKFINNESFKSEILLGDDKEEVFSNIITINSNNEVKNLEEAINSTVTIKVDKGLGSGCVVSNDGYIITNFHVVSGVNENMKIFTKDGKSYEAKLIRKNEELDLALLKVDANFEKTYVLPTSKGYTIGQDVFAIGTPGDLELGQTLSKGIVSAIRTKEGLKFIQTDASVNPGNSGGALVNKSGKLIGIVNSKILGLGVEGLAFAIPAEIIKEFMSLE